MKVTKWHPRVAQLSGLLCLWKYTLFLPQKYANNKHEPSSQVSFSVFAFSFKLSFLCIGDNSNFPIVPYKPQSHEFYANKTQHTKLIFLNYQEQLA